MLCCCLLFNSIWEFIFCKIHIRNCFLYLDSLVPPGNCCATTCSVLFLITVSLYSSLPHTSCLDRVVVIRLPRRYNSKVTFISKYSYKMRNDVSEPPSRTLSPSATRRLAGPDDSSYNKDYTQLPVPTLGKTQLRQNDKVIAESLLSLFVVLYGKKRANGIDLDDDTIHNGFDGDQHYKSEPLPTSPNQSCYLSATSLLSNQSRNGKRVAMLCRGDDPLNSISSMMKSRKSGWNPILSPFRRYPNPDLSNRSPGPQHYRPVTPSSHQPTVKFGVPPTSTLPSTSPGPGFYNPSLDGVKPRSPSPNFSFRPASPYT